MASGCSESPPPATGTLSTQTIHSDAVGDDYLLRVRLPPGYDDDPATAYPLVVQLDPTFVGLQQYDITVGLVSQHAAAGDWPEAIVVGVDYDGPSQRQRDYLPPEPLDPAFGGEGADRFYTALRDELLPHLEDQYRIDPSARTLVGHSNGGIFVWYSILRHDPMLGEPLFSGAIALDNGYDQELFTLERWHSERSDSLPMQVYAARATHNGAVQEVTFDAMIERIDERGYEGLQLDTNTFETDHGGVILPGYEDGLDHVLGGGQ